MDEPHALNCTCGGEGMENRCRGTVEGSSCYLRAFPQLNQPPYFHYLRSEYGDLERPPGLVSPPKLEKGNFGPSHVRQKLWRRRLNAAGFHFPVFVLRQMQQERPVQVWGKTRGRQRRKPNKPNM